MTHPPIEFRPDPAAYWRAHGIMALAGGVVAGIILVLMDNPTPWVGPLGAALAIALRAAYVRSESMAEVWHLTDSHLAGPGNRRIPRETITRARPLFGAVQVITRSGDKHLIKYLSDPAAVAARIQRDIRP